VSWPSLLHRLPEVRGKLIENASLADITWLRVGGPAQVLFLPADAADLARFLAETPRDIEVRVLGAGSNTLVRDGGLPGVTVKLTPLSARSKRWKTIASVRARRRLIKWSPRRRRKPGLRAWSSMWACPAPLAARCA
jgi:hypothetical protein